MKKAWIIVLAVALIAGGVGAFLLYNNTPAKKAERLISKANECVASSEIETAESLYLEAVEKYPDNPAAYDGLIDCYIKEDKAEALVDLAGKLSDDDSKDKASKIQSYFNDKAQESLTNKDIETSLQYAEYLEKTGADNSTIKSKAKDLYKDEIENLITEGKYEEALSTIDAAEAQVGQNSFDELRETIPYAILNNLNIIPLGDYECDFATGVGDLDKAEVFDDADGITVEKTALTWHKPVTVADEISDGMRSRLIQLTGTAEISVTYDEAKWNFQIGYDEPLLIDYYSGLLYGSYERDMSGEMKHYYYDLKKDGKHYPVDYYFASAQALEPIEQREHYTKLQLTIEYLFEVDAPEDYDGLLLEYHTNPRTDAEYINIINGVDGYEDENINPSVSEEIRNGEKWTYQFDSPEEASQYVFMKLE